MQLSRESRRLRLLSPPGSRGNLPIMKHNGCRRHYGISTESVPVCFGLFVWNMLFPPLTPPSSLLTVSSGLASTLAHRIPPHLNTMGVVRLIGRENHWHLRARVAERGAVALVPASGAQCLEARSALRFVVRIDQHYAVDRDLSSLEE